MWSPRIARVAVSLSLAVILTVPADVLAQGISRGGMGGGGHIGGRIGGRAGALVRPGWVRTAPRARLGPSARAFHPRVATSFHRRDGRGGFRGGFDRPAVGHVGVVVPRHHPGSFGFPRHHFGSFRFPHRHAFFGFPHHHFGFVGFPHHHFGFFGFPRHHFGFFGFPHHHFGFGAFGFPHPFGLVGQQTLIVGGPLGLTGGPYTTSPVAVRDSPQGFEARPALDRRLAVPGTGAAGDSLVLERVSILDVVPATAVRLTWRSAGLDAEEVVLFLADTAQSTLAAQTLRQPPYTALFEAPAGTAFAGMSVMWPDGTTSTRVVPYRPRP